MIRMHIVMTSKSYSNKDKYRMFDETTKIFPDMKSAKQWIKETYGNAKRFPIYVDTKEGTKKVGYTIGFRNADVSHYPVEKWLQRDWISFYSSNPIYFN